ncbi:hypothetical protein C5167_007863 [Papaver somniferum]|nr:hypothetical protein C5167_007863 [Papaver somniferum]
MLETSNFIYISNYLQKLVSKAKDEKTEVNLHGFPGGPNAFEICAKSCYGMTVTLNAYNVVAARCGAEYLKMTEDIESGNLIFKIEIFLNFSVFRSWKDSIIVLQATKYLLPWSEDLKVAGRCIDSIASKTSVDPANINWDYTYSRRLAVSEPGNDICDLEIDIYKRVIVAIKSKGRMLVATLVEVGDIPRAELVKRINSQLDKASVQDLLIPARWPETTVYDIALVQSLVDRFAKKHPQELDYAEENERSKDDLVLCRGVWMDVGKLIDGYLAKVAYDPNVLLSIFVEFSQSIPTVARPVQESLYSAIDIYLKCLGVSVFAQEHPSLTKSERKKICGLMDVSKLTVNASMHAAQNE